MTAVDTNVLVRFLVKDDEKQAQRARKLIEQERIFIPKTVLVETEWVLRYTYELGREAVAAALAKVCGLSQVTIEDGPAVRQALAWHQAGLDFADALHLASSRQTVRFCSFDQELIRRMKREATVPVVQP
jgi:predicted nucleic-acid-binding protein